MARSEEFPKDNDNVSIKETNTIVARDLQRVDYWTAETAEQTASQPEGLERDDRRRLNQCVPYNKQSVGQIRIQYSKPIAEILSSTHQARGGGRDCGQLKAMKPLKMLKDMVDGTAQRYRKPRVSITLFARYSHVLQWALTHDQYQSFDCSALCSCHGPCAIIQIWFPELNARASYLPPRHSFCSACDFISSAAHYVACRAPLVFLP